MKITKRLKDRIIEIMYELSDTLRSSPDDPLGITSAINDDRAVIWVGDVVVWNSKECSKSPSLRDCLRQYKGVLSGKLKPLKRKDLKDDDLHTNTP